jgi:hypothetical protein
MNIMQMSAKSVTIILLYIVIFGVGTGGSGLIGWILGWSKPAHEHALDVFSKLHDIINSSSELTSCECD